MASYFSESDLHLSVHQAERKLMADTIADYEPATPRNTCGRFQPPCSSRAVELMRSSWLAQVKIEIKHYEDPRQLPEDRFGLRPGGPG